MDNDNDNDNELDDNTTPAERARVQEQILALKKSIIDQRAPSSNCLPKPLNNFGVRPNPRITNGQNAASANDCCRDSQVPLSTMLEMVGLGDDIAIDHDSGSNNRNDGDGAGDGGEVDPWFDVNTVDEVYKLCCSGSINSLATRRFHLQVLRDTLERFEQRWIYAIVRPSQRALHAARCLFNADADAAGAIALDDDGGIDLDHIVTNMQLIHDASSCEINRVVLLQTFFDVSDSFTMSLDGEHLQRRFSRLLAMITVGRDYLIDCARAYNASLEKAIDMMPPDVSTFRFSMYNALELTGSQSLLVHVLRHIRDNNYRRIGDLVYSEVSHTYRGRVVNTHAWKVCLDKFEDLVRAATRREIMFKQWNNLTSCMGSMDFVVKYLQNARQDEFPTLKPDRRVIAFRNGVFVCGVDEDVRERFLNENPDERDAAVCSIENAFYRWGHPQFPGAVIACNFVDQEFDTSVYDYDDPFDVETPNFDKILKYQRFDDPEYGEHLPVMRWLYALGIGRMMYDVRDRDRWECLLFLKGIAGSGKSTCSEILSTLYPKNKIGAVSNRIEKQFGLGALYETWVWIAKDLKSNFGIDQGDLQSMITGEEVSVAIKHHTARTLAWTTPGLVLGNETANWIDASGSMTRRLVLIDFARRVASNDVDTELSKKIRLETPRILYKANAMYLEYTKRYHDRQIWDVLPPYFLKQREAIQGILNPLIAFLCGESSEIVVDDIEFMPFDEFAAMYKTFCRVRNFSGQIRFNEDHYRDVFSQKKIEVLRKTVTWRGNEYTDTKFIFGVGVAHNHDI